jgi:hypothetical protein
VVEHSRTYPNVYCDFSYFTEILEDGAARAAFVANLEAAFAIRTSQRYPYAFSSKAMYGSDWHMPTIARRTAEYLDCLVGIFDSSAFLRPHREAFLAENARRFLDGEHGFALSAGGWGGRRSPVDGRARELDIARSMERELDRMSRAAAAMPRRVRPVLWCRANGTSPV